MNCPSFISLPDSICMYLRNLFWRLQKKILKVNDNYCECSHMNSSLYLQWSGRCPELDPKVFGVWITRWTVQPPTLPTAIATPLFSAVPVSPRLACYHLYFHGHPVSQGVGSCSTGAPARSPCCRYRTWPPLFITSPILHKTKRASQISLTLRRPDVNLSL